MKVFALYDEANKDSNYIMFSLFICVIATSTYSE
jgi:hypothetical protein